MSLLMINLKSLETSSLHRNPMVRAGPTVLTGSLSRLTFCLVCALKQDEGDRAQGGRPPMFLWSDRYVSRERHRPILGGKGHSMLLAVTQLVGLRLLISKSYMRSLRYLSASCAGPRALPLAASEDDDDRFAKRRKFFEKFVAKHTLHNPQFKVSTKLLPMHGVRRMKKVNAELFCCLRLVLPCPASSSM